MGVLNRIRCVKLLTVFIGLYYVAILNYHRIENINFFTTSGTKSFKNDFENIEYGDKEDWFEEKKIIERTSNCETYFQSVPVFAMNQDIFAYEKETLDSSIRLAFSHMLHNQVAIYEAFLAMYFRPYNYYCIHIDRKADDIVRKAVEGLVKCYAEISAEMKVTTGSIFVIDKKDSIEVFKT